MNQVLLYKEHKSQREMKQRQSGPEYFQDIPYAYYDTNETEGAAASGDSLTLSPTEPPQLRSKIKMLHFLQYSQMRTGLSSPCQVKGPASQALLT